MVDPAELVKQAAREAATRRERPTMQAADAQMGDQSRDPEIDALVRWFATQMAGLPMSPLFASAEPTYRTEWTGGGLFRKATARRIEVSEQPMQQGWIVLPGTDYPHFGANQAVQTADDRPGPGKRSVCRFLLVTESGQLWRILTHEWPEANGSTDLSYMSTRRLALSAADPQWGGQIQGGPWDGNRATIASWCGFNTTVYNENEYFLTDRQRQASAALATQANELRTQFPLEIAAGIAATMGAFGRRP